MRMNNFYSSIFDTYTTRENDSLILKYTIRMRVSLINDTVPITDISGYIFSKVGSKIITKFMRVLASLQQNSEFSSLFYNSTKHECQYLVHLAYLNKRLHLFIIRYNYNSNNLCSSIGTRGIDSHVHTYVTST